MNLRALPLVALLSGCNPAPGPSAPPRSFPPGQGGADDVLSDLDRLELRIMQEVARQRGTACLVPGAAVCRCESLDDLGVHPVPGPLVAARERP